NVRTAIRSLTRTPMASERPFTVIGGSISMTLLGSTVELRLLIEPLPRRCPTPRRPVGPRRGGAPRPPPPGGADGERLGGLRCAARRRWRSTLPGLRRVLGAERRFASEIASCGSWILPTTLARASGTSRRFTGGFGG